MEITMDSVKSAAREFEGKIKRRNLLEWLACGFVIVFFFWKVLSEDHILVQLGSAGVVLSAFFIGGYLFRKGRTQKPTNSALSTTQFLDAHCQDLENQEKLLRSVPIWYLGPFAVSIAVIQIGKILEAIATGESILPPIIGICIVMAVLIAVGILNLHAASKLRKRIDNIRNRNLMAG